MSANFPMADSDDEARRPDPFPYSESEDVVLTEDYLPTRHDVINGRGRKSYNHIANRRFRQLIACNLERYLAARCKVDKTLVVVGIVDTIRNDKPTGGFLKRCTKSARWISMSDESAREKVGHCLRDMIASQRDDKKGGAKSGGSKTSPGKASKLKSANPPSPRVSSDSNASPRHKPNPLLSNSWQPRAPEGLPAPKAVNPAAMGGDPTYAMWASLQAAEGRKAAMRGTAAVAVVPTPSSPAARHLPPMPPLLGQQQHTRDSAAGRGPSLPMNLNNLDPVSLQKGNLQDMSEQQRRILAKLENGWKGTVEELMEAVK